MVRGFAQLYLIAAVAGLVAIGGAYVWGRYDGGEIVRAEVTKRDNESLKRALAQLDDAHTKLREQERAAAVHVAQVSADYQKELSNVRQTTRDRTAAVQRGDVRLRDPGSPSVVCPSPLPGTAPTPGGRDGPAPGDLSAETSRFLLELTGEADEVAKQLNACQRLLVPK
jgi:prophage endopeptidase